ncbi:MAG: Gfo/Idh/MocA family oxidoreductase [bacterium]|nr:Gfo/Idh/MocA family oxidoreductase [bacterium]
MTRAFDRRTFLGRTGLALAAASVRTGPLRDELAIAFVGAGGQGWSNLRTLAKIDGVRVAALCDVDTWYSRIARSRFPQARQFRDYRAMLVEMGEELDAVCISTPDHMHAPVAVRAMELGLHCYCEKPLAWAAPEARLMARIAREKGLVTQMGNGASANDGFRAGVELLRSGALGKISEVHVWTNRPIWPQAVPTPKEAENVPDTFDWDLWLGCAPERPFHTAYHPFRWRGWYDFGTGALGDMACHTMNLPFQGLELGAPRTIEAETSELFDDSYPAGARVTWRFEGVRVVWYEGTSSPPRELGEHLGERELSGSGCLVLGEAGALYSRGGSGTQHEVLAKPDATIAVPEPFLERSPGHHAEWVRACRGDGPAPMSAFATAGPFSEAILLGNLAMRLGQKIEWDAETMTAEECPAAEPLLRRTYRDGHVIDL